MNIINAYYDHILNIFMEVYGENIKNAQPGNCMKVTGFSMDVLRDLSHQPNSIFLPRMRI